MNSNKANDQDSTDVQAQVEGVTIQVKEGHMMDQNINTDDEENTELA